jgi:Xaa-Pro aminopeptidase
MKRGLVLLDPAEIPAGEWRDRVAALQREMADTGTDAALIYGDVSRSDDIAYLTNLCVYWNEGVLAVPAQGEAVFLTKLSPRVHPWMKLISTVTEIRSGRSLGELVAGFLGQDGAGTGGSGTAGLVEADLWPAAVAADIRRALPGWEVRPLGPLVRELRRVPSPSELTLLRHAAGSLAGATAAAAAPGLSDAGRIAAAEGGLRGDGFLDVLASTARTTDGVTSMQVTGQYRYLWLHTSRIAEPGGAAWPVLVRQAIAAAVAAAVPGATAADLDAAARPALAGLPGGATAGVRWVHAADMATNGEYADDPAGQPIPAGSVVVVGIDVRFSDGKHASVAETVLVADGGPVCLTGQPDAAAAAGPAR